MFPFKERRALSFKSFRGKKIIIYFLTGAQKLEKKNFDGKILGFLEKYGYLIWLFSWLSCILFIDNQLHLCNTHVWLAYAPHTLTHFFSLLSIHLNLDLLMLSLPKGKDRSFTLWKNHVWNTGMRTKSVTLLLLTDIASDMYSLAADSNDER